MANEPKENKEKILTKGSNMATTANTHYSYLEEKESGRDKLKIKTNNFLKLKWWGGNKGKGVRLVSIIWKN